MKKFLLIIVVIACFFLLAWQVYRFTIKYENYKFFTKQNNLIYSNEKRFVNESSGDLYYWVEKNYQFNNKITKLFTKEAIPQNHNLFFYNTICGEYLKNYAFALYKPKKIGEFTKNGYSIIVPIVFNGEIVLINYYWNESLDIVKKEIEKLNNFQPTGILSDINENLAMCFSGILVESDRYFSKFLNSIFIKNNTQSGSWSNLNVEDVKEHFADTKLNISPYFLDSNLENLSQFIKNYQHHIFYAIMWFISACYLIYIIEKFRKD